MDSRPERLDKKAENVQKTKKTQRQRTVSYIVFYHSFISNDFSYFIDVRKLSRVTERHYWNQINHKYMSFELSDEDEHGNSVYNVHQPVWRSQCECRYGIMHKNSFLALSSLIRKLDGSISKREESGQKQTGFKRLKRLPSDFSMKSPSNAPSWILSSGN